MTPNKTRKLLRVVRRLGMAFPVLLIFQVLQSGTAAAQTPVEGPWRDIHQIFWFTDADYDITDPGSGYTRNAVQRFAYGDVRRSQCYHFNPNGPEADEVNGLYWMMSCRLGLVTGAITWIGVGIALMALAWGGVMWVVDAGAGGERGAALRNMVSGPLIGLGIMFFAYIFARFAYTVIRYNFDRYISGEGFWL